MEQNILCYVGEKVIEDLRGGIDLNDNFIITINKFPFIDYVRSLITIKDINMVVKLMKSKRINTRRLGISLTRKLINEKKIKDFLFILWKSSNEYDVKRAIMFQLLNIKDLSIKIHNYFYGFIKDNWKRWLKDQESWYGGRENILTVCKKRLADPSTPESKDWIYLCIVTQSTEKAKAKKLIYKYLSSKISINKIVAMEMLHKF